MQAFTATLSPQVAEVTRAMELGREAAAYVSEKFIRPVKLEFEKASRSAGRPRGVLQKGTILLVAGLESLGECIFCEQLACQHADKSGTLGEVRRLRSWCASMLTKVDLWASSYSVSSWRANNMLTKVAAY